MSDLPDIAERYLESLEGKTDKDLEALAYKSPVTHFGLFMRSRTRTESGSARMPTG